MLWLSFFQDFLHRRQRRPTRSGLLVIIGWLVGWLVSNGFFSETALTIFLIFCMKLGDYKGRIVTEPDFWKKFLIWRYSLKRLQISPKSDTDNFFGFRPEVSTKYHLQFEWNLFFGKICYLEMFDLEIVKKIAQIKVFGHFLDFASLVFLDFTHNDRWAWCLVVFLHFAGPVNVFLLNTCSSVDHLALWPQSIELGKMV